VQVGVELTGAPELVARLDHAHQGLLDLSTDLQHQLERDTTPMRAFASPTLHARAWGAEKVWTLPAGAWVADSHGRVGLPEDPTEKLTTHVQQLLDD
jgi:hypothetical protein